MFGGTRSRALLFLSYCFFSSSSSPFCFFEKKKRTNNESHSRECENLQGKTKIHHNRTSSHTLRTFYRRPLLRTFFPPKRNKRNDQRAPPRIPRLCATSVPPYAAAATATAYAPPPPSPTHAAASSSATSATTTVGGTPARSPTATSAGTVPYAVVPRRAGSNAAPDGRTRADAASATTTIHCGCSAAAASCSASSALLCREHPPGAAARAGAADHYCLPSAVATSFQQPTTVGEHIANGRGDDVCAAAVCAPCQWLADHRPLLLPRRRTISCSRWRAPPSQEQTAAAATS